MLEAELKSKLDKDFLNKEDLLTSTFFGVIDLTKNIQFIYKLLKTSKNISNESLLESIPIEFKYLEFIDFSLIFWQKTSQGKPDIIIKLINTALNKEYFIILEIKLYSGKSSFGKNDQLINYVKMKLNKDEILSKVIYLTYFDGKKDVSDSINQFPDGRNFLFLLTWTDIYKFLKIDESLISQKLASLLEKRWLIPFSGFDSIKKSTTKSLKLFYYQIKREYIFKSLSESKIKKLGPFYVRNQWDIFPNISKIHESCNLLLNDLDSLFAKNNFESIFGNIITSGISSSINSSHWHAEGLFRYWKNKEYKIVPAITIFFHHYKNLFRIPFASFAILTPTSINFDPNTELDKWILWEYIVKYKYFDTSYFKNMKEHDFTSNERTFKFASIEMPLSELSNLESVKLYYTQLGIDFVKESGD